MNTQTPNLSATMSPYGYPLATFEERTLTVARRAVVADSVIWDAPYGAYRVIGFYARKDGTAGRQIAKPLAFAPEVPADIRAALAPLI